MTDEQLEVAVKIARNESRRFWPYGREDMIQIGLLGAVRAAKKFDPARGVKWFTFCRHYVIGEMRHWPRDHGSLVHVTRTQYERKETPRIESLDEVVRTEEGTGTTRGELTVDPASGDAFEDVDLALLVSRMPAEWREVVFYYYEMGLTQDEIASAMRISQKHVSRLFMKAGRWLRKEMAANGAAQS